MFPALAASVAGRLSGVVTGFGPPSSSVDASQLVPYFGQFLSIAEAENFTSSGGGWEPRSWAHSPGYFAANQANCFMSRRAYLHADANVTSAVASSTVRIGAAGVYSVLLRYEALYRFETPVHVSVYQNGQRLFDRVYGYRSSPKVWGYPYGGHPGACPGEQSECVWSWGSTDNTVWEGVGATVALRPGTAEVVLNVTRDVPGGAADQPLRFADRNVDVVMLHPNASDLALRLDPQLRAVGEVPFDGLLSQAGEVFFKVTNYGKTNFSLQIPRVYGHSPYFAMHLTDPIKDSAGHVSSGCAMSGGPRCPSIEVAAGAVSDWVDVGGEMDVLQHGSWNLHGSYTNWTAGKRYQTEPFGDYKLTVGVKLSAEPISSVDAIGDFDAGGLNGNPGGFLQLLFDASTRASRRVRPQAADLFELMEDLDAQTKAGVAGKPLALTPIFANTYPSTGPPSGGGTTEARLGGGYSRNCPRCDGEFNVTVGRFHELYNIQPCNDASPVNLAGVPPHLRSNFTYIDVRRYVWSPPELANVLQGLQNATSWGGVSVAKNILVVSLGDELSVPSNLATDAGFVAWASSTAKIATPAEIGCTGGSWAAVIARCNQTTKQCETCGMNMSIASAIDAPGRHRFYYSNRYNNAIGYQFFQKLTKMISAALPNARVGANFSPYQFFTDPRDGVGYAQLYVPNPFQWIRLFRGDVAAVGSLCAQNAAFCGPGLTLPWSEDWAWANPIGSQQMVTMMVDMMRSAMFKFPPSDSMLYAEFDLRAADPTLPYRRVPNPRPSVAPPLLMYVMHHFPGNTATSWRRQFFGDIAHGVKYFDLFDFVPSFSGYTDDYVDPDGGAYPNVRRAFFELSQFEDIVQQGAAQPQGSAVAMLFSESANYWLANAGTMGSAKRTLYMAIRHGGYPIDPVIEEDLIAGRLRHYDVLYINDAQVSEHAAAAVATWVSAGGTLFATAGALGLNEFNESSAAGAALLGPAVETTAVYVGSLGCPNGVQDHRCMQSRVQLEKQDLPFVEELDQVTISLERVPGARYDSTSGNGNANATIGVYGEKAILKIGRDVADTDPSLQVVANFSDGAPAVLVIPRGKGKIWYSGFHPGLSYFRTALPDDEPPCKGSTDENSNHRVTVGFDQAAADLVLAPLAEVEGAKPVTSEPPLVEVGVVSAHGLGTVLPCINWSGGPQPTFNVSLHFELPHPVSKVSTATGAAIQSGRTASGFMWFSFALELGADAIILRY